MLCGIQHEVLKYENCLLFVHVTKFKVCAGRQNTFSGPPYKTFLLVSAYFILSY